MFHIQEDLEVVDYWNSSNYPSIFRAPQNYPIIFSNLLDAFKFAIESYLKGFPSKALQKCPRKSWRQFYRAWISPKFVWDHSLYTQSEAMEIVQDIILAEVNELRAFREALFPSLTVISDE